MEHWMALDDPVAVYNAANNLEAHLIVEILGNAGIEAAAVDDVSQVGLWMGGFMPEIHKPQVWVDRADVEPTVALLRDYEARAAQRRRETDEEDPVVVLCESCGHENRFAASRRGAVEACTRCGHYLDVEEPDEKGEWLAGDTFDEHP
jgi:hypothetical protein